MKFHRSIVGTLASLAVAVTPALAGPRGYLPFAGPTPLRFSSGARSERAELPPLPEPTHPVVPEEPTTGTAEDPATEEDAAVTTTEERAIPATRPDPEPPEETASAEPAETTVPATEARPAPVPRAISPQQLITYFTAEPAKAPRLPKAKVRPTVIAPVVFVPPTPGQKSVSQATYSTGN